MCARRVFGEVSCSKHRSSLADRRFAIVAFALTSLYAAGLMLFYRIVVFPALEPSTITGILPGDPWMFHSMAVQIAQDMARTGWRVWTLRPDGAGNVGVLAILYRVFGPAPWLSVALNSILHGIGCVALIGIAALYLRRSYAVLAAMPFILSPYQLAAYSQPNKDSFAAAGFFVMLLGWCIVIRAWPQAKSQARFGLGVLLVACGIALLSVVRPYLVHIIFALTTPLLGAALWIFLSRAHTSPRAGVRVWTKGVLLTLTLVGLLMTTLSWRGNAVTWHAELAAQQQPAVDRLQTVDWQRTKWLPAKLDYTLYGIAVIQRNTFRDLLTDKNLNTREALIDLDVSLHNVKDVVAYVPRALQIGLLAPFPTQWSILGVPSRSVFRNFSTIEMILVYFSVIALLLNVRAFKYHPEFYAGVWYSLTIITVYAIATPHLGVLDRYRYPFLMAIVTLGLVCIALRFSRARATIAAPLPGEPRGTLFALHVVRHLRRLNPRSVLRRIPARFRGEISWVAMGQVCVLAGGIASLKLLAKSLGAAGYGQFAIGLTIAGALGALIYGPISQAATRFWSVAYGRQQLVLYQKIVSGGYLASVLFCALCLVGGTIFLKHSALYSWLVLVQLSILFAVFSGASVVAAAVLNATRKRAVLAAHQAAEALLRPVLIIAAVWLLKADARAAMLAYCVTTGLVALSMSFFAAKALATSSVESTGPILDTSIRSLALEMAQYCVPFVLFALLGMAGQYGDRWLLEQWYGSVEVGRYAAMYQLSSWPMIFLLGILNQFVYPIIFARAGDVRANPHPVGGHSLYRLHILSSALVIAVIGVAAYLFGEFVVRILTSAQFVADHESLWIIAIGVALFNVAQQLTLKGMYLNRPSAYIVPKTLQSLAFVAIALLIGQGHGVKGVAFAYCASTVIYLGSVWIANRKLSHVARSGYERLSDGLTR